MRGYRLQDLTGKRFGSWTVLRRVANILRSDGRNMYVAWECVCDCGFKRIHKSASVKKSHQCRFCLGRSRKPRFGPREAVLREFFSNYRSSAKRRGHEWSLQEEKFREIVESPCFFCGSPPKSRTTNRHGRKKKSRQQHPMNGIDRLNNLFGYTEKNSVPCCITCNRAKLQMSASDYVEHCKNVWKHSYVENK